MATSTTAVRLSEEIQSRLEALGKLKDRSPHYLMKKAIEEYLDQEEAVQEERLLVQERWEKYELTGESVAHEDAINRMAALFKTGE